MKIKSLIKQARQRTFLMQDSFAKEIHVSVPTINRWENGKLKPNLTAMKKSKYFVISKAFNILKSKKIGLIFLMRRGSDD